jgi:branched-chain amino acid aminotransferase
MTMASATGQGWSTTWTFFDGDWHDGNVAIMGARTHAAWLGSSVFDGARAFEAVTPDLARHCARVNASASKFFLKPQVALDTWLGLVGDGLRRFDRNAALYIRPMYWAEQGGLGGVAPDAESTRWCLCLYELPFPNSPGSAITLSPFRRPTIETAPLEAKAGCLYPNNARALIEAAARGFDNCILCDMLGNVAELGTANIFMVQDGVVYTPVPNGTFLNGITRQRVIELLRGDGVSVIEKTLRYADFLRADEIFASGNYTKLTPITRIDDRALQPGPIYRKARELYWAFAHG